LKNKFHIRNRFNKVFKEIFFLFILVSLIPSCKESVVEYQANNCKKNPAFIKKFGYDPALSYLSTSDQHIMGLVLIESSQPGKSNVAANKKMQHPSWTSAGWLAPILIASTGDIYTAPAPYVNIFNNPINNNNTIYKINSETGIMEPYLRLPDADSINTENPFGIIAMALLCDVNVLYVSTLAGSKRHNEKGHIYAIDLNSGKIIDQLNDIDAMGLAVCYTTGKRELYFGKARDPQVEAVEIDKNGHFSGNHRLAFSLEGLGPRGDDKVRKIRLNKEGTLTLYTMEFNFNLIAPREKQENLYNIFWDEDQKKWIITK